MWPAACWSALREECGPSVNGVAAPCATWDHLVGVAQQLESAGYQTVNRRKPETRVQRVRLRRSVDARGRPINPAAGWTRRGPTRPRRATAAFESPAACRPR